MRSLALILTCCLTMSMTGVIAQEADNQPPATDPLAAPAEEALAPGDEATHNELRALRDALVEAVNGDNLEGLLAQLDPNVVVIWQNGEISRGHDGVRTYYDRIMKGDSRLVERFTVEPEVQELTILYGDDSGIAFGTAVSRFDLTTGNTLEVKGPWDATLVKKEGAWKIASFHASVDMFDNPFVKAAERALYWTGGIAAAIGLALGATLMAVFRRKSSK